jgi:hypothetical protein
MMNFVIAAALAALASAQAAAPANPHQDHAQHGQMDHKSMQHEGHDMACCKDKAADCCKDKAKSDCCKHEAHGGEAPAGAQGHQHQR